MKKFHQQEDIQEATRTIALADLSHDVIAVRCLYDLPVPFMIMRYAGHHPESLPAGIEILDHAGWN